MMRIEIESICLQDHGNWGKTKGTQFQEISGQYTKKYFHRCSTIFLRVFTLDLLLKFRRCSPTFHITIRFLFMVLFTEFQAWFPYSGKSTKKDVRMLRRCPAVLFGSAALSTRKKFIESVDSARDTNLLLSNFGMGQRVSTMILTGDDVLEPGTLLWVRTNLKVEKKRFESRRELVSEIFFIFLELSSMENLVQMSEKIWEVFSWGNLYFEL